jgi:hypothetical protein
MGTNYYVTSKEPTIRTPIHIGKSSIGWKFLFHEVDAWENWIDGTSIYTYPQWVTFLENNKDIIVIMNEYDEVVELEELLAIVEKKQCCENDNNFTHAKNIDGYRFTDGDFS